MSELLEEKQWGTKGRAFLSPKNFHQRLASLGTDLLEGWNKFINSLTLLTGPKQAPKFKFI